MRPFESEPAPIAMRGLAAISLAFVALLVATSGGYGYHRDELYFIMLGGHPALGYVDQPPLVPLLASAMNEAFDGSLVWLRLPSALAGGLMVLVTGLIGRELGARRHGQLLAAGCVAVSAIALAVSHLMSTTAFDLLGWSVISWLFVRAARDGGPIWLVLGLVAGVALQVKTLPLFLLLALVVGLLAVGPRDVFRSRWPWMAALVALAIWAPNLWWQATHGWPQLELSRSIASGSSGTSEPRWLFLPYQLVLISPVLVPVWITGLVRLARDPRLTRLRAFAVAYPLLAVIFIATGGKPYYLCGLYPVLLAAGAEPTLAWVRRGAGRGREVVLAAALVLSLAVAATLFLPLVPAADLDNTPIATINYDAGETVGWPRFAQTVAAAYDEIPANEQRASVFLARNYGEAGAVDHFAPDIAPVYSGHNSLYDLGPPPESTSTVIAVGYAEADLRSWFSSVRQVDTIDNGVGLDNDEQGNSIWLCSGPRATWSDLWPMMRRLG